MVGFFDVVQFLPTVAYYIFALSFCYSVFAKVIDNGNVAFETYLCCEHRNLTLSRCSTEADCPSSPVFTPKRQIISNRAISLFSISEPKTTSTKAMKSFAVKTAVGPPVHNHGHVPEPPKGTSFFFSPLFILRIKRHEAGSCSSNQASKTTLGVPELPPAQSFFTTCCFLSYTSKIQCAPFSTQR